MYSAGRGPVSCRACPLDFLAEQIKGECICQERVPPFYLQAHVCLVRAQVLGPSHICSIRISKERSQKSYSAVVEDGDGMVDWREGWGGCGPLRK